VENWKSWQLSDLKDLSSVFYSFLTLDPHPNPDAPHAAVWDGVGLYESMTQADIIDVMTEPEDSYNWKWQSSKIRELQQYCAAHGIKFIWAFGGWSDLTQTIRDDQIPALVDKIVALLQLPGAHGIDFDWEHVSEHSGAQLQQQRLIIGKTICALRSRLNQLGLDHMDIVYTPRYNAFWQGGAYSSKQVATDGEGLDNFGWLRDHCPHGMGAVSYINFMVYDMSATEAFTDTSVQYFELKQYKKVVESTTAMGIPASKIVIGFEPGPQAYTGLWAGMDADKATMDYLYGQATGGVMWWAMNENAAAPNGKTTGQNAVTEAAYAAALHA